VQVESWATRISMEELLNASKWIIMRHQKIQQGSKAQPAYTSWSDHCVVGWTVVWVLLVTIYLHRWSFLLVVHEVGLWLSMAQHQDIKSPTWSSWPTGLLHPFKTPASTLPSTTKTALLRLPHFRRSRLCNPSQEATGKSKSSFVLWWTKMNWRRRKATT